MTIKSLCIFCGSRVGKNEQYQEEAIKVGEILAKNQVKLVYGGGRVGLMGSLADSVLESGGEVTGVIPESLVSREVAHFGLSVLKVVNTMHERKELMYQWSDAFLALPGGFGTLDEFCEIFTWFQLGIHQKPVAFLNIAGYFDSLIQHFQHSVHQGFVDQALFDKIKVLQQSSEVEDFLSGL
ncbi:TIGR00730 family Rossman fold protein [Fulvivirgaceae bacterium BMA12]|uniref:Cytokinin riboside 5'-monophosphate phosphoribohydrolase n=1 Tax=Agaribacillus aureus TaxID=3051825 RepID=A0ABT8L1I6_9BACT|nr:TIGR00730 family Rossman fold protein [Fulvivirgaceae bacterium BMA12]